FNMDLGDGVVLKYATAQPLCMDGDTWLFMEIPDIKPEFEFANPDKKADIKVISMDEAKLLRKVDGKVYYAKESGKTIKQLKAQLDNAYQLTKLDSPAFEIPEMYSHELKYQNKPITWYSLNVEGSEGFVDIDLPCDVIQVYVDDKLVMDEFYHNLPFRLPKSILQGEKVYIVCSNKPDGIYIE
ncbi:hypothetical protein, partial [Pseudobutyrivibrio sp.]|uniref:hypothetical protein n=1 Tax=Pseudobutyrivibrio sp. TaxID=2014367 RepID=UPI001B7B3397